MRLLLVEDDAMIGESVQALLKADGHAVDWVRDGRMADTALLTTQFDAVVLDLGLPHMDGLQVLRQLRARHNAIPVLIATARDAVAQRIEGLDAGADDYIVKPYDVDELQARLRALVRRQAGIVHVGYTRGAVHVDPASRSATLNGHSVALSAREWALVAALTARPGQVLSRAQLEEKLYGWGEEVGSNTVEVYVHSVRKKLGADMILNVRGVGYMVPKP